MHHIRKYKYNKNCFEMKVASETCFNIILDYRDILLDTLVDTIRSFLKYVLKKKTVFQ